MDHQQFDRLTRLLGTAGTRRTTLGAVLGAALGGLTRETAAKPIRRRRRKQRAAAQALPGLRTCLDPKPGQNLSKCDFSGRDLRSISLRGANLSGASFVGAELCGTDLRGANLAKVDFRHANLTRVDLRGTNLSTARLDNAIFCQTRRPNGKLDSTHCVLGSDVCCRDSECDGVCQRGVCSGNACHNLGQLCDITNFNNGGCCQYPGFPHNNCAAEADLVTYRCQQLCDPNHPVDCTGLGDFECRTDFIHCPIVPDHHCCQAKQCTQNSDCGSNLCCAETDRINVCCRSDQRCGVVPFELPCVDK